MLLAGCQVSGMPTLRPIKSFLAVEDPPRRAVIWPKSSETELTLGIDDKFMRGSALGFVLLSARSC
jgi:hypothetical protein